MAAVAELARIRAQLERMRALCGESEDGLFAVSERVSGWSTAEHIDHLLKVTGSILKRLPSAEALPKGISFIGRLVLALRWIPRGRGRSPARLVGQRASTKELLSSIEKVTASLASVDAAAVDSARTPNVPHPLFGGLTPSQALCFAVVHNDHHLKIVRDIQRGS